MNEQQAIKFNCFQVSDLLDVLERFGISPDISDAHASAMFSELIVKGARLLDKDQAESFFNGV